MQHGGCAHMLFIDSVLPHPLVTFHTYYGVLDTSYIHTETGLHVYLSELKITRLNIPALLLFFLVMCLSSSVAALPGFTSGSLY
jgi:hypothetical protein